MKYDALHVLDYLSKSMPNDSRSTVLTCAGSQYETITHAFEGQ